MRFYFAILVGKLLNLAINIIDKKRGTNFSGKYAMKIDPRFVSHIKGIDESKVLFITGTNGKSTTTNFIHHIFTSNGKKIICNLEGANLIYGIATALLKNCSLTGKVSADYYIFETDERFLPLIKEQLHAKNLLITNLQKDQVQRNGDPDFIYRKLKSVISEDMTLFVNNDEPRSASLGDLSNKVITYGVEKHLQAFNKDETYPSMACPRCGHGIKFRYYNNDNIGKFECRHCDFKSAEEADYQIRDINFENGSFTYNGKLFSMPYNTPFMLYNYASAIAVAREMLNLSDEDICKSFNNFKNISGRIEFIKRGDKTIHYMRIKQENPETLQTAINVMANDDQKKVVCIGLGHLPDFVPYYTNSFYAFDCDFSKLVKTDVEKYFVYSTVVNYDTANRLIYEGVDPDKIEIIDTDDFASFVDRIDECEARKVYMITFLMMFDELGKLSK